MTEEQEYLKKRERLEDRKRAYQFALGNKDDVAIRAVIADLKRFCRAGESTFHPNERVHAVLEGRREVILRILDHLELNTEDFLEKYLEGKKHE